MKKLLSIVLILFLFLGISSAAAAAHAPFEPTADFANEFWAMYNREAHARNLFALEARANDYWARGLVQANLRVGRTVQSFETAIDAIFDDMHAQIDVIALQINSLTLTQWRQAVADGRVQRWITQMINIQIAAFNDVFALAQRYLPAVTGVRLAGAATRRLETRRQINLSATVTPANAVNHLVTWSSSNRSVATVDARGRVTAVGPGTATITVRTVSGNQSASVRVTVYNTILGTGYEATTTNWLLFFFGFGWIWMWF